MDRTARVAEEIKREIGLMIQIGLKDPRIGSLVSVLAVDVTRDYRHATVWVSVLGDDERRKEVSLALDSAKGFIRREIGSKLQLRYTPELHFKMDDSIEKGIYMSKLIEKTIRGEGDGV